MTEYTDIDQINALRAEQANIDQALTILDDFDGTVSMVTVASADTTAPMPVMVAMADPPQSMIAGVRSGLIQRYNQINQELRDLGVTGTPPNHGPPTVETQPV
jgi:hypothetical protein